MTAASSIVPVADRHFEDFVPGAVAEFGPIAIDEAEVVEFARRYDPQPIHTDPAAAAAGPFGGLIASGWHTASLVMRDTRRALPRARRRAGLAGRRRAALAAARAPRRRAARPGDRARSAPLAIEARSRPRAHEDRGAESGRAHRHVHDGDESFSVPRSRDDRRRRAASAADHLPRSRISTAPPPPALGGASQYASTSSQCASHWRTRPLSTGSRLGDVSPLPWIARTQR